MSDNTCAVDGCERARYSRGLCEAHYRRQRRTGSIDGDRAIGTQREPRTCMVDDCTNAATERGLCHGHYLRVVRLGHVQEDRPLGRRVNELCRVDGCGRLATAKQLCKAHAGRLRKFGDVQADKPIREVRGTGYLDRGGYLVVPVPRDLRHLTEGATSTTQHRLVMAQHLGRPLREDESVHHLNGSRTDNRIENLELWSRWQPSGQRVSDKVTWAIALLRQYRCDALRRDLWTDPA
jgi:hypothetical protein